MHLLYLEGTNSKITMFTHFLEYQRNREKKLKVYMVLGDAVTKLQTFVWIFNYVSNPCSTLEHQTWSHNQSQHNLFYGGVNLSISLNLILAPVPYAPPKCQFTL